ncbi:MAG: hypothetical protein VX582_01505, partial [Actinomycetota bacterium]|nr:hypothetical protein [Actinomycetota bacterium]
MSRRKAPQRSVRRTAPVVRKQSRPSAPTARSTRSGSTSKQTNTPQSASPQRKLRAISAKPATGRFKIGNQRRRIQIVVAFVLVMLIVISLKVIGLQTAGGDAMRAEATNQWTRTRTVVADRGTIFDRDGEELAVSIPAATISINPKLVDNEEATLNMLATMLNLSVEEQQRLYDEMVRKEKGFVYVRRQIDADLGGQIAALKLSGVNVDAEPTRLLPGGDTGRSVIGRTDIDGIGIA